MSRVICILFVGLFFPTILLPFVAWQDDGLEPVAHLPIAVRDETPTPQPTATPTVTPTPQPCEPRPRKRDARDVVLRPGDLPTEYALDFAGETPLDADGVVMHSDVFVWYDGGALFVGPAGISSQATVYCREQGATDAWQSVIEYLNGDVARVGQPERVTIAVGEQHYALRAYDGQYVYYGAASRHDNVVTIVRAVGINGFFERSEMHDLLVRMESKAR